MINNLIAQGFLGKFEAISLQNTDNSGKKRSNYKYQMLLLDIPSIFYYLPAIYILGLTFT